MTFCHWHTKTVENQQGTDCAAHLCEGRIFACPYRSVTEAKRCSDFEPLPPAPPEDQP